MEKVFTDIPDGHKIKVIVDYEPGKLNFVQIEDGYEHISLESKEEFSWLLNTLYKVHKDVYGGF